jgi:hypothetical protein
MPTKNEVQILEPKAEDSFLTIFQVSTEKGYDPEFIKSMMELQERNDANNARKAYHEAMSAFKMNPPDIEKDKKVSYTVQGKGTTSYNHASLANVTSKINKALSEHGLSAAWITSQSETGITVTCTITHRLGHSESTSLTAMPDTSGGKNSIQAIGSSVTYLQRYTLLALTGLATHDMDDDGNGGLEYINEKQKAELVKEFADRGINVKKFNDHFGIESIDTLPAKRFSEAITAVQQKPKAKAE